MEFTAEQLSRTPLKAPDGEVGYCKDLLFDEENQVVRYLVADTHKWMPFGHKVVISPIAIDAGEWNPDQGIPVHMTKRDIKNSPPLSSHLPVSREYEIKLFRYYGYGYYWMGAGLWGTYPHPSPLINAEATEEFDADFDESRASGLRSTSEVTGYRVEALDGVLGQLTDFVIDDENWVVKKLLVSSHEVLPGGETYEIPSQWITEIDWTGKRIQLDHDRKSCAHLIQSKREN